MTFSNAKGLNTQRTLRPRQLILGLVLALVTHAQTAFASEMDTGLSRIRFELGEQNFKTGNICFWSGLALVPVSVFAAIPVMHDGAFGITAADPTFAIVPALLAAGLMHGAIPFWGWGAENMEQAMAAGGFNKDLGAAKAWQQYQSSWRWMAMGGGLVAAAVPFAVIGALNMEKGMTFSLAATYGLVGSGFALIGYGLFQQYAGAYQFFRIRQQSKSALAGPKTVQLVPVGNVTPNGELAAGLQMVATF
jgi:hypothetical protein